MFTEAVVVGNGRIGKAAAERVPTRLTDHELTLGSADLGDVYRALSDIRREQVGR